MAVLTLEDASSVWTTYLKKKKHWIEQPIVLTPTKLKPEVTSFLGVLSQ